MILIMIVCYSGIFRSSDLKKLDLFRGERIQGKIRCVRGRMDFKVKELMKTISQTMTGQEGHFMMGHHSKKIGSWAKEEKI